MSDEEEELRKIRASSLPYELPTYYKWEQRATFYHPMMAGSIDGTDVVPHDRAVWRAMRSKYKPNKRVSLLLFYFLSMSASVTISSFYDQMRSNILCTVYAFVCATFQCLENGLHTIIE